MAEICCGVVSESKGPSAAGEPSSRAARRRRMEIRRFKFVNGVALPESNNNNQKRKKPQTIMYHENTLPRECDYALEKCDQPDDLEIESPSLDVDDAVVVYPKFGYASVCGRREDMEDSVALYPSFIKESDTVTEFHYFGVYDGHGCSHVATRCKERLHELVREEFGREKEWKSAIERSFMRMDKEVIATNEEVVGANCRCELQTPECDAVGSTAAVAIITPDKIIVANCGDSRAVLCRNGKAVALSTDHKPDRPDELNRIEGAGGRVLYWDCPRVEGFLAMSRAIGDNYLKPYVSCEPEVTITERTADDDCLIIASDGLWDVVSNETACGVATMCLREKYHAPPCSPPENGEVLMSGGDGGEEISDRACSDASLLLTKLALARHTSDNVSVVVVDLRRDT
ncbi:PP2C domain-containing protein [Cephalotus follicularis]|uniref:protein-serine/threonine phosphatase n=1 Tax=Cephalotus follicularis TaxID=3775 RepID=A0A1Q3CDI5_CEPFO|nr:PP2C domain-containing protein [Cephalotus follicularis]